MKRLKLLVYIFLNLFVAAQVQGQAIKTMEGGWNHSLITCDDGSVWLNGRNNYGQFGFSTGAQLVFDLPTPSSALVNPVSFAAGAFNSYFLFADGSVWSCGYGNLGLLGEGSIGVEFQRPNPEPVPGISNVWKIDACTDQVIALKNDSTVWMWGSNAYGLLGDSSINASGVPVQITGLNHIIDVSVGRNFALALKSDGSVWVWGKDLLSTGILASSSLTELSIPMQISGLSNVIEVEAGYAHALVLKADGSVWAWGEGQYGGLGRGGFHSDATPTQILGLSGIVSLSAAYHSMALKSDSTLWIWGQNSWGQLGNGEFINSATPALVPGISGIIEIASGIHFSMAHTANNAVWAWGDDHFGQLGIGGDRASQSFPAPMRVPCLPGNAGYLGGKIIGDLDADCLEGTADARLANWEVMITDSESHTVYTKTNAEGDFLYMADTGVYTIRAIPDGNNWDTSACFPSVSIVHLSSPGDSNHTDFFFTPTTFCPQLEVNIHTPFLRRCMSSTFYVEYCNHGTAAEDSATIEIDFDAFLTIDSASVPMAALPGINNYEIDIGTLPIGACGSFEVYTTLGCESVVSGQGHCTTAHIYPDSFCVPPNPLWNEASIQVSSRCEDEDTLKFTIENVGSGNMLTPGGYIVIEDVILKTDSTFQLNAGDSLTFKQPANGSTWTLQAEQVPEHPGKSSLPTTVLEGCGVNSAGTFTTGILSNTTPDDEDFFLDIDWQENVESFESTE